MKQTQLNIGNPLKKLKRNHSSIGPDDSSQNKEEVKIDISNSALQQYRDFIKKQQKEHPWIYCKCDKQDKQLIGIYCHLCQDYVEGNNIVLTNLQKSFIKKPSTFVKTNAPRDHTKSLIHTEAFKWKFGPLEDRNNNHQLLSNLSIDRLNIKDNEILVQFLATYFLAKENIALSKFPNLLKLLKTCQVDYNEHYQYTQNNNIIINHCLSHRLNLGSKDIWSDDSSLFSFNSIIHTICRYFSKSSKNMKILNEEEEILLQTHLKLLKPIDVRWLSIYRAIVRILELYPSITSALEIIIENESCLVAEGLLSKMKSIQFVCYIYSKICFYIWSL